MSAPKNIQPLPPPLPFQTPGEEIANSILHGLGILLAIAGLVLLTLRASGYLGGSPGGPAEIACYVVFTATMISMFLASTLYHAIQHEGAKRVFQILDHSAVYLLIAGTYTPFSLLGLRGAWGWAYFGVEWALAVTGIVLYSANLKFLRRAELSVYIIMGWAIAAGFWKLYRQIPFISFALLVAGGAAYTFGTFWYRRRHRRGSHVIWHIHVIAGAACHWLSLWFMS
ncbi:MAG: hemolysin III family protein [Treponema sp.]|jgi:hemolysin III|nr:hemolysin III family protein [Treponema sp.]